MRSFRFALSFALSFAPFALVLSLAGGCTVKAGPTLTADAGGPDASTLPPGPCGAELIDLDDPGVGVTMNGVVTYMGNVRAGDGTLEPQAADCGSGTTRNERVHKITVTDRSRVTAIVSADNLSSIVYIRTSCEEAATELDCRPGGARAEDVAAGQTVYIVVDAEQMQPQALPQGYSLDVYVQPVLAEGLACDPTRGTNVCETGLVCSVAGGAPICAASLGGPSITAASGRARENGNSIGLSFAGTDPDGDVVAIFVTFLDGAGDGLDFNEDGTPDEIDFTASVQGSFYGTTMPAGEIGLLGLAPTTIAQIQAASFVLVDSADLRSEAVVTDVVHPVVLGLGETGCTGVTNECEGELVCVADACASPAETSGVCAAAATAMAISASGSYVVNIGEGAADQFQGSCYWDEGLAEAVLRVTIPGPDAMRLTARTDAPPSSDTLDSYLYLRSACGDPGSELACNDDLGDSSSGSQLASGIVTVLAPGDYYLVVDGSYAMGGSIATGMIGVSVELIVVLGAGEVCILATDVCAPEHLCHDLAGGTNTTCTAISALAEAACTAGGALTPGVAVTGTFALRGLDLFNASCAYTPGWAEEFHELTLAGKADVTLSTAGMPTDFDTVVYVLSTCGLPAEELACNDDIDTAGGDYHSYVEATLEAGTYGVVVDVSADFSVDGSGAAPDPGSYRLLVTVRPVRAATEACDAAGVADRCDDGLTCMGTPPTCQ